MRSMTSMLLLTFLLQFCSKIQAQEEWGGKVGLNILLGTHIQRIGVMYQVYYFKNHTSISHSTFLRWNKRALGPKASSFEAKMHVGIQGQWLKTNSTKYLINDYSNMSPFMNSMGYNLYVYLDNRGMSQTTGAIYGSASSIIWAVENDALGLNQIDDKYRTGGFYVGHLMDSLLIGVQSTLWTANSSNAQRMNDARYPSRFGYRDISNLEYGNFSHGILAINAQYKLNYNQVARADVGIDSERIRHALQNKLIHDGLSKRVVKSESAHYPMLQDDGSMFLFKEGEQVKKPKAFFQIGANESQFY